MGSIDAQYQSAEEHPKLAVVCTMHCLEIAECWSNDGFQDHFEIKSLVLGPSEYKSKLVNYSGVALTKFANLGVF